jgi:succinyl-CoA synthetase alpha subunit
MSILIDDGTRIIVQGITGHHGSFHTKSMLEYGTKIVAGVTPGKGGESVEGVPVFGSVKEALARHKADWSVVFVPAPHAKDAALEALSNNLNLVIITEGIPVLDTMEILRLAKNRNKTVIGPNCPGILSAGKSKLGIIPAKLAKRGNVGIISRSGTLTYELILELSEAGMGQSTIVGLGGDELAGSSFVEMLELFERDRETEKIVLIGEIGGGLEEQAAEFLGKTGYGKEAVAFIAGMSAPKGKRMGHAGAIIYGGIGSAENKIRAFEKAGVKVAKTPGEVIKLL